MSLSESASYIFPKLLHEHVIDASIGIGENPATGAMMYFVHPCNTAVFMEMVKESTSSFDYLNSWLTFIPTSININN